MTVYICKTCGRQNSANLTFCQDCGSRLSSLGMAPTPHVDGHAAFHPKAPTPGIAGADLSRHPMAPTPAIPGIAMATARSAEHLGELGNSARPALRLCSRCQGSSLPSAQFCKFCGSAFTASVVPLPPRVPSLGAPRVSPVAQTAYGTGPSGFPSKGLAIRVTSISKDGAERESYPVAEALDFGRTEGDALFADDKYLSPRHARIFGKEGKVFLQDLSSVNGTYYRLKETPFPLDDQDLILLGQQVIRFETVNREDWPGPGCEHGTLLFGTPAGRPHARLTQRGMEGIAMNVYYLRSSETVLGREIGDIVFTDDPFMSRRHAVIRRTENGTFNVSDVGSSNGTFVRVREPVELSVGDEFRVGQQLFRINPLEGQR